MLKRILISLSSLALPIISGPIWINAGEGLAIKTDQEDLKINNIYFLGDSIYETGTYTNSLTSILKKIVMYSPIIPSIPKEKAISLPHIIITIIHLVMVR